MVDAADSAAWFPHGFVLRLHQLERLKSNRVLCVCAGTNLVLAAIRALLHTSSPRTTLHRLHQTSQEEVQILAIADGSLWQHDELQQK